MRATVTVRAPTEPSREALALSRALTRRIHERIASAGGWIRFDRYMQSVLNEPGLGYYSAGSAKFGGAGDFITAPALGPFLARAIATQFDGMRGALDAPVILEIGAGDGTLAAQLLDALDALDGVDAGDVAAAGDAFAGGAAVDAGDVAAAGDAFAGGAAVDAGDVAAAGDAFAGGAAVDASDAADTGEAFAGGAAVDAGDADNLACAGNQGRGAPVRYLILEPSADLRSRQRERLAHFADRVSWLERLPERPVEGLILANEVVDALPVVRFVKRGDTVLPLGVRYGSNGFEWAEGGRDAELDAAIAALESALGKPLPDGYRSEICLLLGGWMHGLAASLARGAVLLVDYGGVRRELYHPERSDGTLICHYRHRAHADPFYLPGLQDVSAWVDFSACADAARGAGFDVAGFTTQGLFLAENIAGAPEPVSLDAQSASALKTLVLPGEMGERFRLLLLSRGIRPPGLPGRDLRGWL